MIANVLLTVAAVFLFVRSCFFVVPGIRKRTVYLFAGLLFCLAPAFGQAVFGPPEALVFLVSVLGSALFGLRFLEFGRLSDLAVFLLAGAVVCAFGWPGAAAVAPFAGAVFFKIFEKKRRVEVPVFASGLLLAVWLNASLPTDFLPHFEIAGDWSASRFFQKNELSEVLPLFGFVVPNAVFAVFPLFHPQFFLLTFLLFFAAKKTDFTLRSKKLMLASLAFYLLAVGGLAVQRAADLLPAYAFALLLFLPAWDRFISYGFYFLKKKWMHLALGLFLAVQLAAWIF